MFVKSGHTGTYQMQEHILHTREILILFYKYGPTLDLFWVYLTTSLLSISAHPIKNFS